MAVFGIQLLPTKPSFGSSGKERTGVSLRAERVKGVKGILQKGWVRVPPQPAGLVVLTTTAPDPVTEYDVEAQFS